MTDSYQESTRFIWEPQDIPTRKPRLWPLLGAISVVIAATVGIALALTSGDDGSPMSASTFPLGKPHETQLRQAFTECHAGDLGDDDHTLVIDTSGDELASGSASMEGLTCVLDELETPQSVISKMYATRALDGMQSGTWSNFEASWTYHPDAGLDLIITQQLD